MRRFLAGWLAGLAIAAGFLVTRHVVASPEQQTLYTDFCIYRIDDVSYWLGLPYGSVKHVSAVTGNWDGWFVTDYQARAAVGDFGCQRFY
ncbi:MAG TPA: hypothetical protein VNN12_02590 [Dehalococcoidia bacterium]|nr:hypothetical protein [Dehalococcoidia bacterium]